MILLFLVSEEVFDSLRYEGIDFVLIFEIGLVLFSIDGRHGPLSEIFNFAFICRFFLVVGIRGFNRHGFQVSSNLKFQGFVVKFCCVFFLRGGGALERGEYKAA